MTSNITRHFYNREQYNRVIGLIIMKNIKDI